MSYSLVAKRLRLPLGFAFAIAYLAFARPQPTTLVVGAVIAFVGVLVRAWASGHIMKNDRLATTGPYAHTRNPLYFGSFLIGAGFAIAAHPALLLVVIAFWVLVYMPTIERERVRIKRQFPDAYPAYEENVPSFVPRATPWRQSGPDERSQPFSFELYMKHGEWKAALVYVLAIAWLYWRMTSR